MKQTYLFCLLFVSSFSSAQIINFLDANLKAKLLTAATGNTVDVASVNGSYPGGPTYYNKIDTNNDGEIQISEALQIKYLNISSANITNLTGLSYFSNLENLRCNSNQISNLSEVNLLINLKQFHIWYNKNVNLSEINLTNLINLQYLQLGDSNIKNLNVANNINLIGLSCQVNKLTTLDVSNCPQLEYIQCFGNLISYLNLKNGNPKEWTSFQLAGSSSDTSARTYSYICADEEDMSLVSDFRFPYCHMNTYCSFTPGNYYHTIQGKTNIDNNSNGCDINDDIFKNLNVNINNGTTTSYIINDTSGNYFIPVGNGDYTITPILENPDYFNITPTNYIVNFPSQSSPFTQDFCVTPNGNHHDVEVLIIPTNPARPGFDAKYKIIYKNKGNQVENGTIDLQFDDTIIDLVSTSPTITTQTLNNISFNYSNLNPLETREIYVVLNINSPMETPAVNSSDRLDFIATITQNGVDEFSHDNTFDLKQIVVNSYDPNDKTCLEGDIIAPDKVGNYVYYVIRFENTGTFPAENIVVKDMIDTKKFDISSLIPVHASHNYFTKIADNKVEFIFENINLPFDDANNDGYISFKIKTLPTLVLGDAFSNSANIYFDYNFPIVTNTATTTIIAALSNPDFEFANYFGIYPNPTTNELNINLKQAIEINSIQIYNTIGQLVSVQTGSALKLDVSQLKMGNYFIKINTNEGFSASQFIKK
ncbi:MAG TPA: T9SS type A sorting domain-containing protein [Flavobacterium sp.]